MNGPIPQYKGNFFEAVALVSKKARLITVKMHTFAKEQDQLAYIFSTEKLVFWLDMSVFGTGNYVAVLKRTASTKPSYTSGQMYKRVENAPQLRAILKTVK